MSSSKTNVTAAMGVLKAAANPAAAPALSCFAQQACEIRCHAASNLNAWSLSSEAASAANAKNSGKEFHPGNSPGNHPKIFPKGELELRNTAAGSRWRERGQQKSDYQR